MALARLPFIMAYSRFIHYLMVLARDHIGGFRNAAECEEHLNRWVCNYVALHSGLSDENARARYPLIEAHVRVQEIPGHLGSYQATASLRPWLPTEQLNVTVAWAARLPSRTNFRAPPIDPAWLCNNGGLVPRVAQAIRNGRQFTELPVLADALEEVGCTDVRILGHCREDAAGHDVDCWVLDALLERG
jgi:hypothetical protein